MLALAGVPEDAKPLPIHLPRSLQVAAQPVVFGKGAEARGQIRMVRRQHASSDLERLREHRSGCVGIRTSQQRCESEHRSRGLLVLVAVHAAMPVERLLKKAARP